jgi:hypothetical protein
LPEGACNGFAVSDVEHEERLTRAPKTVVSGLGITNK